MERCWNLSLQVMQGLPAKYRIRLIRYEYTNNIHSFIWNFSGLYKPIYRQVFFVNRFLWFSWDNDRKWKASTWRFFEHFLMTDSVLIHFISCLSKLPASASHNLMYSVSLSLRRIQLPDLTHRLGDWHFCGMQDADRIESDGTSDSKLVTGWFICLFIFNFVIIHLFIHSRRCKITKNVFLNCNIRRF